MKQLYMLLFLFLPFMLFALEGDVDSNGTVDILDALRIAKYSVGLPASPFNSAVADVGADGAINIVDALAVARFWAGLIPYFPSSTYKKLPVPAILQGTNMCGPASALMYAAYQRSEYGARGLDFPTQAELYTQMRASDPPTTPGVTAYGLCTGLNSILYKNVNISTPTFAALYIITNSTVADLSAFKKEVGLLNSYEPSIVYWYNNGNGHFVVVVGYDVTNNNILYIDPYYGSLFPLDMATWITKDFVATTKERVFIAKK